MYYHVISSGTLYVQTASFQKKGEIYNVFNFVSTLTLFLRADGSFK